jgi:adsorption protein B
MGWAGGLGERWMRLRDRRGPLAALLIVAAYLAALLWSQLWLATLLGAPVEVRVDLLLAKLLAVNAWLVCWRVLMRAGFTASAYGLEEGLLSMPRLFIGNLIAVLSAFRALSLHLGGRTPRWDKTQHIFPKEAML